MVRGTMLLGVDKVGRCWEDGFVGVVRSEGDGEDEGGENADKGYTEYDDEMWLSASRWEVRE